MSEVTGDLMLRRPTTVAASLPPAYKYLGPPSFNKSSYDEYVA